MSINVKRETCGVCHALLGEKDWYYCKPCRTARRNVKVYDKCGRCGSDDKTPTDYYCRGCRRAQPSQQIPRPYRPNPAGSRKRYLKRLYGLSPEEYADKLEKQGGRCAICGSEPEQRNLDVDHNHQTNQVRSLLCNQCNQALGLFNESSHLLEIAIEYLRRWNQ